MTVGDRPPWPSLLDDELLEASAVVANCLMNRERQLHVVNSYSRELEFNPLDFVTARIGDREGAGQATGGSVGWLDLCCGTGRAVIQAAQTLRQDGRDGQVAIVGVDLVDGFAEAGSHDLE